MTQSTRERALEAALRLCLPHAERIAATTPTTPTRAQRQTEAATAATNARIALALPPSPEPQPAAPVADDELDPIDILIDWCAWHYQRYGSSAVNGAPIVESNAAIARATGREG